MSYQGVGRHVSICQATKNRIQGRVTDSNRMIWRFFTSLCRFSWPFMMGQQTESNSFYQRDFRLVTAKKIRTSFGHVKKAERTSAVSPEHYIAIKGSCRRLANCLLAN